MTYRAPAYPQPPIVVRPKRAMRPRRAAGRFDMALLGALLGLFALALLPLAAGLLGYAYFQLTERIVPGVYVGNAALGGKTLAEAAVLLHGDWNLGGRTVTISDGTHNRTVPLATLGLSVDALKTAQQAAQVGHNQPALAEIDQMASSLFSGWGVAPVIAFDPAAAQAGLQALSAELSQPARNASLRVQDGQLVTEQSAVGYTINIPATIQRIAADPLSITLGGWLEITPQPVLPQVQDVTPALAQAQALLAHPGSYRVYDAITNEWLDFSIPAEELARWLLIENGPQGPQVSLDPMQAAAYLEGQSQALGSERWLDAVRYAQPLTEAVRQGAQAVLLASHRPTTYTVQPGDTLLKVGWKVGMPYWRIQRANPEMDPNALRAGQQLVVPSKDDLLPLPVVMNKRIVISIGEQHLWAYQDGQLVADEKISTGIDRSPTQPGVFQVQTHEVDAYASLWDLHMPHWLGIYEAWPGFFNGIHGLPTLRNGQRLWANILGRPASYGCIILNLQPAEWLFNWAENGVVVEIVE